MAFNTDISLQNKVIYSIYVRNHTEEGTFAAIIPDLPRIKALGTDIIWFMPIHPIGIKGKKGSLGCPYANRDYRDVNPEYGTMEDFIALVDNIHALGMKCMIDVVYNHTAQDSVLLSEHPEWFYRRPDGSFGNKIGDWEDVIDLDYSRKALWDYQIKTLCDWAKLVDGFRCDAASFVPVEFWDKARSRVAKVNPDCIWLAETVHFSFGSHARAMGIYSARDPEVYNVFDIEYEYDIREVFERCLEGKATLSNYLDMLNYQDCVYPESYNKLRFLENHDTRRIANYITDDSMLENYTAMLYFLKGTTLIYAGQEYRNTHTPSLFEYDPMHRSSIRDISKLMCRLSEIKHDTLSPDDSFSASADDENGIALMVRRNKDGIKLGVFCLQGKPGSIKVPILDGDYSDLISEETVTIKNGALHVTGAPVILNSCSPVR